MSDLIVSEIFCSIQGESTRAGFPCAFVRLAGCNLRCSWCDTPYAQRLDQGERMTLDSVLERVNAYKAQRVEVTGGEPLTQSAALELLTALCDANYETLLETNGSQDISDVDGRVRRIVDFKCPSSGEVAANRWSNAALLTKKDEVKFVIADRTDFNFAADTVMQHRLLDRCDTVTFSPVAEKLEPAELARWILQSGLDVRLGVQLHKIIWPTESRGV